MYVRDSEREMKDITHSIIGSNTEASDEVDRYSNIFLRRLRDRS